MSKEQRQSTDWVRVTVHVTAEAVEAAGEILRQNGCAGWETAGQDTVIGYFPADERAGERVAEIWEQVRKLGECGLDPGSAGVLAEVIPARPWEELWKSYFHPTRLGKLIVTPTWEPVEPGPEDVILRLDPGMAFGSGAHATTRLCLRALQEELPPSGSVLDVGTGSGILAIAAALLGAKQVLAVDNDPEVLPIAAENAELNGVAEQIEIREGDIFATPQQEWNVILANIAPDPVKQAAKPALERLVPGGAFIGAGIPATRSEEVQAALNAAGLPVARVLSEGEWVTIVAHRPEKA